MSLLGLHPALEPRRAGWLAVDAGHEIWFEDCGALDGLPVVFLHGGPGSGCRSYHRQFFDPTRYRIILFDQRGAGRSRPLGRLEGNDTWALVRDIELLRQSLGIERWVVFGGSWGATLALCYAAKHPERVLAQVLRGSFLARPEDLDWFFVHGASRMLPDAWQALRESVAGPERDQLFAALYRRVFSADLATAMPAAEAWSRWGAAVATSNMPPEVAATPARTTGPEVLLATSRIELHYAVARYFLADSPVLGMAAAWPRVPSFIVHGLRDLTCVPEAAHALHQAMPWAERLMVRDAGHMASEPAMIDALVDIMNQLPERLA
jgi:proline iminopeptidase